VFCKDALAVTSGVSEDASTRCHEQEAVCSLKNLVKKLSKTVLYLFA